MGEHAALAAVYRPHAFPAGVACGMHLSSLAAHLEHGLRQNQRINKELTKSSRTARSPYSPTHSQTPQYPLASLRLAPCWKHVSSSSTSPWWPASFLLPPRTCCQPHSPTPYPRPLPPPCFHLPPLFLRLTPRSLLTFPALPFSLLCTPPLSLSLPHLLFLLLLPLGLLLLLPLELSLLSSE